MRYHAHNQEPYFSRRVWARVHCARGANDIEDALMLGRIAAANCMDAPELIPAGNTANSACANEFIEREAE